MSKKRQLDADGDPVCVRGHKVIGSNASSRTQQKVRVTTGVAVSYTWNQCKRCRDNIRYRQIIARLPKTAPRDVEPGGYKVV